MKIEGKEYRTIWFENDVVKIIDQTKLPHQFIIKELKTVKDAVNAIKIMEGKRCTINWWNSCFWNSSSCSRK
jgi:hypothetical protein